MAKIKTVFIVLSLLLAIVPAAEARKVRVLGCSSADLNSFGGSLCVRRGEADILNGNSSVHVAVCSGGQIYCCITTNGSTSGGRCTNVSDRTGSGDGRPQSGGIGGSSTATSNGGSPASVNIGGAAPSGSIKNNNSGCSGGVC